MAITSSINLNKINSSAKESRREVSDVSKSVRNVSQILFKRNKIKRESFAQIKLTKDRRVESEKRRQIEDEIEAPNVVIRSGGAEQLIQSNTAKGFFERIIGFIGYLSAGWLMNNLPTWIGIGKEFIARITKASQILSGFFNNTIKLFTNVGDVLGALGKNLLSFDFFDTSNRVKKSMSELNTTIGNMTNQIEEAFDLITTPLTEGKYSGEDIPEVGTEYETRGAYAETGEIGPSMTASGGAKASPYIYSGYKSSSRPGHKGIDISGGPWQSGAPISVIKPGVVVQAEDLGKKGWGKYVVIRHNDGTYSLYGHLSQINVRTGEKIENKSGDAKVIGKVGSTGKSTGPHLHFELGTGWTGGVLTGHMNPTGYIDDYTRVGGNVKTTATSLSTPQQTMMGQPAPNGGVLSTSQLVALAKQAGMNQNVNVKGYSGPLSVLMGAVGMQESRGKSDAMRTDTEVYGLWQIRWPVHAAKLRKIGITSPQQLYDPLTNARAAKMIYDSQGITAWSAFTDGRYKQFLPAAQKAAGIAPSQYTQRQVSPIASSEPQMSSSSQRGSMTPFSITPERRGQDIVVFQPRSQENIITSSGAAGAAAAPPINDFQVLNNFIKNKLLLDLAYL